MTTRTTRVALATAATLLLAACSGSVDVDATDPPDDQRADCVALLDSLPDDLIGLEEREVSPDDALARAWGDPAVVVTCGVEMPSDFNRASPCEEINGVGWFVRNDEFADSSADLDMTTIGFTPAVRLQVPADHRPPADVLTEVSNAVKQSLTRESRCA